MRLGVSNAHKTTTTTNDDNDGDGDGEELYDISAVYASMLCGDTAYFHKKVLPEVVLGEFHAAIRAPSQPRKSRKRKRERKQNARVVLCKGGRG